jgi:uncharacterized membrane protein
VPRTPVRRTIENVIPRSFLRRLLGAGALLAILAGAAPVRADEPVVHAVLFYSPTCPHCEQVITVDLPPLVQEHGDQLQIVLVDVSQQQGAILYEAAVVQYHLEDRVGVPTLIVADTALVGSAEIPERFPALVDELLAAGGVDWPDVPGLAEAMASAAPAPATSADPAPAESASPAASAAPAPADPASAAPASPAPAAGSGPLDRLARDPAGNALALVVLAAMLVVLAWAAVVAWRAGAGLVAHPPSAVIPLLALAGLGVAAYLAFVETTASEAVCGPVGDCNTVQQSEYARLFGLVPIGVLGVAGYVAILAAWIAGTRAGPGVARPARLALLAMAFAGTAFSVYLTFLEPFVIGATCAWCVTSAVLMSALLAIAVRSMAAPRAAAPKAAAR